ncbi:prepilin peptidase [Companilactobacillus sp. DQM5]|uniref:prepilin peptidase n=1 Tax=Companilactobacillus sp. DQM5 TaxID=3463359 RepID=UPI004057D487
MNYIYTFYIFILSTCISSFLCLIGTRMPLSQSIIYPRSHCDYCKKQLKWFNLIPILGYVMSRGKCTNCHNNISLFFPLNELFFGVTIVIIKLNSSTAILQICVLSLLLIFSTMDFFYGIIMPILFIPMIILLPFFSFSLANFFIVFVCLLAFSLLTKGLGFGDVEILSFLALFFPLYYCLLIILISCFFCIIIETFKNPYDKKIHFVPYIYWSFSIVIQLKNLGII